jgi:hypothetical protein
MTSKVAVSGKVSCGEKVPVAELEKGVIQGSNTEPLHFTCCPMCGIFSDWRGNHRAGLRLFIFMQSIMLVGIFFGVMMVISAKA